MWVVSEKAKCLIAFGAQEAPDLAGDVTMVYRKALNHTTSH